MTLSEAVDVLETTFGKQQKVYAACYLQSDNTGKSIRFVTYDGRRHHFGDDLAALVNATIASNAAAEAGATADAATAGLDV